MNLIKLPYKTFIGIIFIFSLQNFWLIGYAQDFTNIPYNNFGTYTGNYKTTVTLSQIVIYECEYSLTYNHKEYLFLHTFFKPCPLLVTVYR
jgi:hypothetical protein